MTRSLLLAAVVVVVAASGCGWLFDQQPVCPAKHPLCWEEDPAMVHSDGNEIPMGASRDAGADQ